MSFAHCRRAGSYAPIPRVSIGLCQAFSIPVWPQWIPGRQDPSSGRGTLLVSDGERMPLLLQIARPPEAGYASVARPTSRAAAIWSQMGSRLPEPRCARHTPKLARSIVPFIGDRAPHYAWRCPDWPKYVRYTLPSRRTWWTHAGQSLRPKIRSFCLSNRVRSGHRALGAPVPDWCSTRIGDSQVAPPDDVVPVRPNRQAQRLYGRRCYATYSSPRLDLVSPFAVLFTLRLLHITLSNHASKYVHVQLSVTTHATH